VLIWTLNVKLVCPSSPLLKVRFISILSDLEQMFFQMHRLSNQNTSIDYQEAHKNNEIKSLFLTSQNDIYIYIYIKLSQSCDFDPLRKKTTKPTPKFCTCGSIGPQDQFWLGLCWRGILSEVPRVFFCLGGQNCYSCKT